MNPRDWIVDNWHWKITALALAVFTWFSIHDWRGETILNQTVQVLTTPGDRRLFRVEPATVEVALRATRTGARLLERQGIQVFVDLTDVPERSSVAREPKVHRPAGIELIKVEPKLVFIERIPDRQTNSLLKP